MREVSKFSKFSKLSKARGSITRPLVFKTLINSRSLSNALNLTLESGPPLPMTMTSGESFSFFGRMFLISGYSNNKWGAVPVGLELVNDGTEWIERPDLARGGAHLAAFSYNDREDRWLTSGKFAMQLQRYAYL